MSRGAIERQIIEIPPAPSGVSLPEGQRLDLAIAPDRIPPAHGSLRPQLDGKFLRVGGKRFWVKGVTYGTFSPNSQGEPYPEFDQVRRDFAQMAQAGINTVRIYTPPSDRLADAAHQAGLYLIPDICWGPRWCELLRRRDLQNIYRWTKTHAQRLAAHPSILMFSIGNEIPPLLVRWYGPRRIESFLKDLCEIVKEHAPQSLVTYACHPPTEHLHLPFLDVVSFNVYLEREPEFRAYLARLQNLAADRPLLLSELGLDSSARGELAQARSIRWQLQGVFELGLCGATVYSWTDDWSIFNQQVSGWGFGLTDSHRRPKTALRTVSSLFQSDFYNLRNRAWPRVSVVVCCYNGASTLDQCLRSLGHLSYPDYEVILIDDGSTDQTPQVAQHHAIRYIRTPNRGLSAARNLGIAESTGSIVAFLDADAYADPHWLYHLVSALQEHDAAAVGGPNLSPPQDGFVAQCVDHAPGNPTHVLIDDRFAEHVPGCNMAFRREALEHIGCFDLVHRAAGDDVDVCWKLLARQEKIAFAHGAQVYHHRRPTIRGFLRQQRGYGFAEAHLRRRYPGYFNIFGHAVWNGGIYDGVGGGFRLQGLPGLFAPRIYRGVFGAAQYQSLYQPFHNWHFQIFTTAEWQSLALSAGLAAGLAWRDHSRLTIPLVLLFVACAALAIFSALLVGLHGCRSKRWRGAKAAGGTLLIAFLQLAQPLARATGRILGLFKSRSLKRPWPAQQKLWGNLDQRDQWLRRLTLHLCHRGWRCRAAGEWDDHDLLVTGPGPYRLEIVSATEERLDKGWFFVRYRIRPRLKFSGLAAMLVLAGLVPLICTKPFLLPLLAPVAILLGVLLRARWTMRQAVSQLAIETGGALKMDPVEGEPC